MQKNQFYLVRRPMDAQTLRRGFSSFSGCLSPMVVVAMLLLIAHVADADVIQARMDENSANKLFFISKFCYSTTGATILLWFHLESK